MKDLWVVDNRRIIYFVLFNLRVKDQFCTLIITNWIYQWGSDLNFVPKASKKSSSKGKSWNGYRTFVRRVNKIKQNFSGGG